MGVVEVDPGFEFDEDGDEIASSLTKKERKALRKSKAAEASAPQRYATVILAWDREESALNIEHPFVPFPEVAGIIQMAEATVRECIENGGTPS